jgi:excisionase family DNA binding protein
MYNHLLSVAQVAERLSLSERYVRTLIGRHDLPVVRIGRRTLIDFDALAQFVEAHGSSSQPHRGPMERER